MDVADLISLYEFILFWRAKKSMRLDLSHITEVRGDRRPIILRPHLYRLFSNIYLLVIAIRMHELISGEPASCS